MEHFYYTLALLLIAVTFGVEPSNHDRVEKPGVTVLDNDGHRPLRIIIRRSNLRATPKSGETLTALSENGSTELHVLGPGLAPFWDFQDTLNFSLRVFVTEQRGGIVEQFDVGGGSEERGRGPGDLLSSGLADVNMIFDMDAAVLHRGPFVYLHPVLIQHVYLFFKQPSVILFRSIYSEPFSGPLWLSLLLAYGLILLLLSGGVFLFELQEPVGLRLEQLSSLVLWTVSTISGSGYSLNTNTTRITFGLNLISMTATCLSIVTLSIYTGLITSTFALRVHPIRSMRDLVHYKYEFVGSPAWELHHDTAEFTRDEAVAAVIFKNARKNFVSFYDIPVKVLNSNSSALPLFAGIHAMHSFWVDAKGHGFSGSEICRASFFPSLATYKYAMLVRKGSLLREVLNHKYDGSHTNRSECFEIGRAHV